MLLHSDYYDTDFELTYKGNKILIRNEGSEGESLYINDVLQDQNFSAYNGQLIGHIFDAENKKEVIEVILAGTQTQDCLIYANGSLVHTNEPQVEYIVAKGPKIEKEKRKSNFLFPFLVIILLAVCMAFYLTHLETDDSQEGSTETISLKDGEDIDAASEYIEVDYSWNYGKGAWTYSLKVPEYPYEYYKTVDRKKFNNYSYYVTDTTDDEYLAGLVEKFKEAAEEESYSDLDMVRYIILFVQNLNYVDDKVGTGYDEYPKFPLETLADEGGDCEDSAILLASLLRELGYGAILIQFTDHMAVGVKGEESIPGSYYEVDGIRYYYVETTSTGWEIGEVPEEMRDQPAKILSL